MLLIEALGESILTSPSMTAKWEQRLSEIGEGNASPKAFMEQVKKLADKLISDANKREKEWAFNQNAVDKITANNPYNKKYNKKKSSYWEMYSLRRVNHRSWHFLRLFKL